MNAEKHISTLLYEHDCVIIPDFGGLVCNLSSARINTSKNLFFPPYKKISFNVNLKSNDGLLAAHIASEEKISYAEAMNSIAEYVNALNRQLSENKRAELKNIGVIVEGEESTLLFEQDETINYLPEAFGLSVFSSPAIKREFIERRVEKKLTDKTLAPAREIKPQDRIKRKIKTRTWLAASVILLVVAFFLWLPYQGELVKRINFASFHMFSEKAPLLYIPAEIDLPEEITKEKSVSSLLASVPDTLRHLNIYIGGSVPLVITLQEDKTAVKKSRTLLTKNNNRYHIIGGAFAVPENAEKFRKKLSTLGYKAVILEKKLQMVAYGSYATREEALYALEQIRLMQRDAWLMAN